MDIQTLKTKRNYFNAISCLLAQEFWLSSLLWHLWVKNGSLETRLSLYNKDKALDFVEESLASFLWQLAVINLA